MKTCLHLIQIRRHALVAEIEARGVADAREFFAGIRTQLPERALGADPPAHALDGEVEERGHVEVHEELEAPAQSPCGSPMPSPPVSIQPVEW